MKTHEYCIEGMNLTIEMDENEDNGIRAVSYLIRALRGETGMNKTAFCAWLGIPLRTLQAWERGEREMPDYVLRLIAYKVRMEKAAGRI